MIRLFPIFLSFHRRRKNKVTIIQCCYLLLLLRLLRQHYYKHKKKRRTFDMHAVFVEYVRLILRSVAHRGQIAVYIPFLGIWLRVAISRPSWSCGQSLYRRWTILLRGKLHAWSVTSSPRRRTCRLPRDLRTLVQPYLPPQTSNVTFGLHQTACSLSGIRN